jgi:hypothetical protein
MTHPLNAQEIVKLAQRHVTNDSSKLAYEDAAQLLSMRLHASARVAALRSLKHSIGIFHPDYKLANMGVD